jgi:hypothetical protein
MRFPPNWPAGNAPGFNSRKRTTAIIFRRGFPYLLSPPRPSWRSIPDASVAYAAIFFTRSFARAAIHVLWNAQRPPRLSGDFMRQRYALRPLCLSFHNGPDIVAPTSRYRRNIYINLICKYARARESRDFSFHSSSLLHFWLFVWLLDYPNTS